MTDEPVAGWKHLALGDIARVYSGGTPSRSVAGYWGGPIPWVTTAEIDAPVIRSTKESITRKGLERSAAKIAPAGTLLMAMYGQGKTRGKTSILGIPAAMNQACAAIEVSAGCDRDYVLYYLRGHYREIRALSNSGGQENLSGEIVKRIPILVPSLPEQEQIGATLRDVSSLVMSLKDLIVKKRAIRQALMQQLLTARRRLEGFSEPWSNVRLGDHVTYLKTVPLSRAQLDEVSPTRYLHYGDIHTRPGARLDASTEPMPRVAAALTAGAGLLKTGDLVFADASEDPDGVGRSVEITGVPPEGVVPGLHTIAARFDGSVLADGFKAYLQFIPAFRNALLRLAAGTKVLATTRTYISAIELALPSAAEQHAIATVLTDADLEIDALREKLMKVEDLRAGMMQELLTGRTRLRVKEAAS